MLFQNDVLDWGCLFPMTFWGHGRRCFSDKPDTRLHWEESTAVCCDPYFSPATVTEIWNSQQCLNVPGVGHDNRNKAAESQTGSQIMVFINASKRSCLTPSGGVVFGWKTWIWWAGLTQPKYGRWMMWWCGERRGSLYTEYCKLPHNSDVTSNHNIVHILFLLFLRSRLNVNLNIYILFTRWASKPIFRSGQTGELSCDANWPKKTFPHRLTLWKRHL